MRQINNLDDIARDLVDSVQAMDAGTMSPKDLMVKRNAYETIVKIAGLKLQLIQSMRQKPDDSVLKIAS
jgi:hypothetical protein